MSRLIHYLILILPVLLAGVIPWVGVLLPRLVLGRLSVVSVWRIRRLFRRLRRFLFLLLLLLLSLFLRPLWFRVAALVGCVLLLALIFPLLVSFVLLPLAPAVRPSLVVPLRWFPLLRLFPALFGFLFLLLPALLALFLLVPPLLVFAVPVPALGLLWPLLLVPVCAALCGFPLRFPFRPLGGSFPLVVVGGPPGLFRFFSFLFFRLRFR